MPSAFWTAKLLRSNRVVVKLSRRLLQRSHVRHLQQIANAVADARRSESARLFSFPHSFSQAKLQTPSSLSEAELCLTIGLKIPQPIARRPPMPSLCK